MSFINKFLFLFVLTTSLFSQDTQSENYLIKNATLHTATAKGLLQKADILIQNGKIIKVASDLNVTGNIQIIDAEGKHITPGLINASTQMGLIEIDAVSTTVDSATTEAGFSASFNISPAINFRSSVIAQNRINGLTRAIVLPSSSESLFAGQAASIVLHSTISGLQYSNVAQVASYGDEGAEKAGGSRAAAMQKLDKALTDAKYLQNNEAVYKPGFDWKFSLPIDDLKALYSVLNQQTPLIISANRADDILRLIKLANKHQFKLVISGGGEAWLVAKELAQANVAVIIDPIENLPQFESLAVRLDGAALLYNAGVKLLFTGGGTHNSYLVRQSAGNAVAYGLPAEAAIEAMTINTAEVFGINNYGQLKAGMDADIVVWDGDPIEITSSPDLVFIQGKLQSMTSRATRLRDRYWDTSAANQN